MIAELGPFVLRDIEPWEGPQFFRMTGDPAVTRYLGFATHSSEAQAAALIERYRSNEVCKWFAVCPKQEPADMLGVVGFEVQRHSATMSLMFRRDWKARGAGRRFAMLFVPWIFTRPSIWRAWSYVHVDNIAGRRATEKTGAQCEGRLRRFEFFPNVSAEPQDVYIYSIVRS